MTAAPEVLARVAQLGDAHTRDWRRGPAGKSNSGRDALARWADLAARGTAGIDAAAAATTRVALMGRVKAGKSTLLNGLVGRRVAGTHAFEMTSAIHEIHLRAEEGEAYGRLRRAGGEVEAMGPEALADLIEQHRGDPGFWVDVEALESCVECVDLPDSLTLYDTPGVGTMTSENAQVANAFLDSAHLIVWVQSGTSLGNAEDRRFLTELARRGCPIITVVSRADLLDEDEVDEVRAWFRRSLPEQPPPIFTDGTRWLDQPEAADRRQLIDALRRQQGVGRNDHAHATLQADLIEAADVELPSIARLCAVFDHIRSSTALLQQQVLAEVRDHVDEHVRTLLRRKSEGLRDEIRGQTLRPKGADQVVQQAFDRYLGDKATTALLAEVEREARERLVVAWGERLAESLKALNKQLASAVDEIDHERLGAMTRSLTQLMQRQSIEAEQGKYALVGVGAVATAYAAWFAANAAAVSIGAAVLSVGLPIVGVGALGLWAKHAWERKSLRERAEAEADLLVEEYEERLRREVLEAKFFPAIAADVEASGQAVNQMLFDEVTGGASVTDVEAARRFYQLVAAGRLAEAVVQAQTALVAMAPARIALVPA